MQKRPHKHHTLRELGVFVSIFTLIFVLGLRYALPCHGEDNEDFLISPFENASLKAIEAFSLNAKDKDIPVSQSSSSMVSSSSVQSSSSKVNYSFKALGFYGGICPHHALAFPMIIKFYEELIAGTPEGGKGIKRVFLFSPDHFQKVRGQLAISSKNWKLNSKILYSDTVAINYLANLKISSDSPVIFKEEHGITIHVPLISHYFPNATIVPILLNKDISNLALLILKKKLKELYDKDTDLIILSMDLSHYKTPEGMAKEDKKTIPVLTELLFFNTMDLDIDAHRASQLTLNLFKDFGVKEAVLLEHKNSSDFLGYRVEHGTSYATILYPKP
jgi:AmmeMemoRadiSam system protein B